MTKFQIPLPGLSRSFDNLTKQEKDFIEYFTLIDDTCLLPAEKCYVGVGPKLIPGNSTAAAVTALWAAANLMNDLLLMSICHSFGLPLVYRSPPQKFYSPL